MTWAIIRIPSFAAWEDDLDETARGELDGRLRVLADVGPSLGTPIVKSIVKSKHSNMKEIRFSCGNDPIRVLFAFDRKRRAVLLVGGSKQDHPAWYDEHIPIADAAFSAHQAALAEEMAKEVRNQGPRAAGNKPLGKKGRKK